MVLPSVFVLSLHKSLYFFILANPLYLKASPHLFKEMPLYAITNPESLLQKSSLTHAAKQQKKTSIFKEEYKNALLTATLYCFSSLDVKCFILFSLLLHSLFMSCACSNVCPKFHEIRAFLFFIPNKTDHKGISKMSPFRFLSIFYYFNLSNYERYKV